MVHLLLAPPLLRLHPKQSKRQYVARSARESPQSAPSSQGYEKQARRILSAGSALNYLRLAVEERVREIVG